jgi:hypothetical protein
LLIAAKDWALRLRRMATRGPVLNPVFTRVVNHCVIVVGLKGDPSPHWDEGTESFRSLQPILNVEREMPLGKKTYPVQYLRAIRQIASGSMHALESGFVNHAPLKFRLGLSQSVFEGRRCGVPT